MSFAGGVGKGASAEARRAFSSLLEKARSAPAENPTEYLEPLLSSSDPQLSQVARSLRSLHDADNFTTEALRTALAPLQLGTHLPSAASDLHEILARPSAGADFYANAAKQRTWHADVKAAPKPESVDWQAAPGRALSVAERESIEIANRLRAEMPGPQLSEAHVRELLDRGALWHRGDTIRTSEAAAELAKQLEAESLRAYKAPTFEERNVRAALVIAQESSLLAASAARITDPAQLRSLQQIFFDAALESGNTFRKADDLARAGAPEEEVSAARGAAQNAAGPLALKALPNVLEALGVANPSAARAREIIDGAAIEDVAGMTSRDLGLRYYPSPAQISGALKEIVSPDDYFFSKIDELVTRDEEAQLLSVGVRLANATWKAGQVHRAALEGSTRRINPMADGRLGVYNPFDNLKAEMYNQTFEDELGKVTKAGMSERDAYEQAQLRAFSRVVFEVYKDLIELKGASKALQP